MPNRTQRQFLPPLPPSLPSIAKPSNSHCCQQASPTAVRAPSYIQLPTTPATRKIQRNFALQNCLYKFGNFPYTFESQRHWESHTARIRCLFHKVGREWKVKGRRQNWRLLLPPFFLTLHPSVSRRKNLFPSWKDTATFGRTKEEERGGRKQKKMISKHRNGFERVFPG